VLVRRRGGLAAAVVMVMIDDLLDKEGRIEKDAIPARTSNKPIYFDYQTHSRTERRIRLLCILDG